MKNAIRLLKMLDNRIGGADWTLDADELAFRREIEKEIEHLKQVESEMEKKK